MKHSLLTVLLFSCALGAITPSLAKDAAAPAAAVTQAERKKIFNAETFTLANGMQVVVIPNHRAPVVTHMVWYKAGAMDEVFGKTGLAHLLEHLMFKGSENVPPGELSKRVRALGGNDNAFTTQDYTAYFQTIAAPHLETVMTMEADRMKSILLPQAEFDSEQQVVLEERRQNIENDPHRHFSEQLRYALFPGHPYATPVIGWENDIAKMARDDALNWHRDWYAPNNAVLVIAGDVETADVKVLAEKIYGPLPARDVHRNPVPAVSAFPGQTVMTLSDPRIHQAQYLRLYRAPGLLKNKTDALALEVLEEIMSGNAATRLYKSLVVEQKLATNASMGISDDVRDIGTLQISVTPADGISFDTIEKALDAELKKIADTGVSDTELREAKTRMKDSVAFATDSLSGPAHIFGQALSIGLSMDDVEYWPYDIDAITADQVKAAAIKYITTNTAYVTGHVIPPQTEAP